MKNRNNLTDLGHKIENLIIDLENELTDSLQSLVSDYKVDVNINYNYKLIENTLDDEMQFRIRLSEGSRTKIMIEFNCMSPTLIFKDNIFKGIAEMINNNAKYDDLLELLEFDGLQLLHDFEITDRRK